jgi:hypothetical protein
VRFNLPRLIGITGKAGVGKDTLADYLVRQHGFHKYAFADPIKRACEAAFGFTPDQWGNREWKESPNVALAGGSPRAAQIAFGDGIRDYVGVDVWINLMEREWRHGSVCRTSPQDDCPTVCCKQFHMVVSDVRRENEAAAILELGGSIIRITRPSPSPIKGVLANHSTERGLPGRLVQLEVANDGDPITFIRNCVYALEGVPRGV